MSPNGTQSGGGCGSGCGCSHSAGLSAAIVAAALSGLGYAVSTQGDSIVNVAEQIDGETYKIAIVIDPKNGSEMLINCQVDTLASAGETPESQRNYLFNAVNINDNIAPFATTVITPHDDNIVKPTDEPLVMLVSRASTEEGDLTNSLRWQMQQLRRAVLYFNTHVRNALQSA